MDVPYIFSFIDSYDLGQGRTNIHLRHISLGKEDIWFLLEMG
jgi:hypothetical protein